MREYKVQKVSTQPPREWSFTDKAGVLVSMETYKVMLEGESEPVEVNRKPGNPPKADELLSGSIETNDYGRRFKASQRPRPGTSFTPKDTAEIKAEWAIGQAVQWLKANPDLEYPQSEIESTATGFFHMVERVKTSTEGNNNANPKEATKQVTPQQSANSASAPKGLDKIFDNFDTSSDVNLDDIPF